MGYLKLKDAGAHSSGLNNTHRIVSARPEFVVTSPLEFAVSGGAAGSPQVQHAQSGLIGAGTELFLRHAGVAALTKVTVGSVNTSGGTASLISRSAGAAIGNAVAYGGLAAAFDGVTNAPTYANCACKTSAPTGPLLIGKDWGAGAARVVNGFKAYGSSDCGFCETTSVTVTATLQGSNDGTNWTDLGSASATNAAGLVLQNLPISSSTAYRYHQVSLSGWNSSVQNGICTEIEFYEVAACTYTLSDLSPAQSVLPEKAYKLRSDTSKALMALACGVTDEPLVKETALTMPASGSYTQLYSPSSGLGAPSADAWNAQSFQVQTADPISKAKFRSYNDMSGVSFDFAIVNDSGGAPGSTVYAQALSVQGPASLAEKEFTFATPFTPTPGTTYWLKMVNHAGGDVPVNAWAYASTGTYAYGQAKVPSSSTPGSGQDFCFGIYQTASSQSTASQVVATGPTSLLPFFASGNLSRDLIVTVGGVDSVVQPNGTVTETGSGPYTTTIPIATQASAPTAARLRSRFQTPVDIASVTWAAGPELTVTGEETEIADATIKRLALTLRSDITAQQMRARAAKIYIKELTA